eukprot:Seg1472.3 transcript_id=Seg1472.3/GoldUCD/mRNA.D3Y31 product="hypothetical protein" protein_id=Seg1472.3/GoldUCD/D3Y31
MASREATSYLSEWEIVERNWEESEIDFDGEEEIEGEEAEVGLAVNENAWISCTKLRTNPKYHQLYIPVADVLRFSQLSTTEQNTFVKDRGLSDEDKAFLTSENGVKCVEDASNAVVCITVKRRSSIAHGTGFFVQVNNEIAVITNSHSIRSPASEGVDFRLVKPNSIKITCFYDGNSDEQVKCEVDRIELASSPEKNMEEDALLKIMTKNLQGDGSKNSEDISNCNAALGMLQSYFKRRDAFLDYALLYLKPLENDDLRRRVANIKALEIKPFKILEHFRNVSSFGISDPSSSKYPKSLRLFAVSHPHCHSKVVSFGGMESSISHVYFLNMAFGQNDTGMLQGKEPFAEHSVTTCKGSSGAPIFLYIYNHETGKVEVDEAVYFLHFFGVPGKLHGKAVSFATIIRNLEHQATHNQLAAALSEVREYQEESG